MPQIIVTAGESPPASDATIVWRERVTTADFESERFAANLVERLGWAVRDATEEERQPADEQVAEAEQPRTGRITGRERGAKRESSNGAPDRERQLEPVGSA
jgi:hypothetical protein